jgi:hypothetical protein
VNHLEGEADRITKIARDGLAFSFEDPDAPDNLRLDTFAIVAVFAWTDEDGDEHEGSAVWSEARRHYVKTGMLHAGLDLLKEQFTDG